MITNYDDPDISLYSLGAYLIAFLKESSLGVHDSTVLYSNFKKSLGKELSFSVYLYVLDWLYLLGMVEVNNEGDIKKCF